MSELDNEIITFRDSMGKVSQFTNGDENTDVQTQNGPIPTLAKIFKTSRDLIANLGNAVTYQLRVDQVAEYTPTQQANARANIGLDLVNNTPDLDKPISDATLTALNALTATVATKENPTNKGRPNGYVGLTGLRILVRNLADTFNGFIASNATDERVWTLPDKSGTVALTSDVSSPETQASILTKLQISSISGVNTGDETTETIVTKLGITQAEDTANKAINFAAVNNVLYPTVQAVKFYVDNLTVGVLRDCGNYDASVNAWPTSGGTGLNGAIVKGDFWYINVPGTLGGVQVNAGDSLRALQDNPAQDNTKWAVLESNIGYVPYNATNPAGYISGITGNMVTVALGYTPLQPSDKNAPSGVVGLIGYAVALKNTDGSAVSILQNNATAARTWTLPDKDGTLALSSDVNNAIGIENVRLITANGPTTTIDLNAGDFATVFKVTITANTTITFTNPPPMLLNQIFNFTLITINGATDGIAMAFGNTIQWAGGNLPPRTTTANAKDVWAFYMDNGVIGGSLAIQDQK